MQAQDVGDGGASVDATAPVFAPNIFTPNGDNLNDRFTLFTGPSVTNILRLQVFDRWGELVHESVNLPPNNPNLGWDGRLNGELLNPAVFVFHAELQMADGSIKILQGDVTLVH
ncbi:MAG: T9SS type B sorting domain-containing protein [Bacteroidota bacterium]